jgi:hypothetical protein
MVLPVSVDNFYLGKPSGKQMSVLINTESSESTMDQKNLVNWCKLLVHKYSSPNAVCVLYIIPQDTSVVGVISI